jgi:hypothetical protein
MGGGAEDHDEARHQLEDGVQVYLPFGRWNF